MAIKWNHESAKAGRVEYEGAVLAFPVWHSNIGRGDYETRYARVWTGTEIADIDVGTVSYGSSWPLADVGVDATPEVREAAGAWEKAKKQAEYDKAELISRWKRQTSIASGAEVLVVSGRKIKIGTVGCVEAVSEKFGVSAKVNCVWTNASNLQVIINDAALPTGLTPEERRIWAAHQYIVRSEVESPRNSVERIY